MTDPRGRVVYQSGRGRICPGCGWPADDCRCSKNLAYAGGVEAVPRRIAAAETILEGEVPGAEAFNAAAAAAAAAIEPLQDPQTDAQYRRELTHAMVYRALMRACPPAGAQR